MVKIIIPTYERSAKLARTLACYNTFSSSFTQEIVVLDGSVGKHAAANKKNCAMYINVKYISQPGSSFLSRVIGHLEQIEESAPVCLGTDEDVFLPDYIESASLFLETNIDYSMFLGRYVTFLRPIGCFNRTSHHRDVITSLDIKHSDILGRISLLSNAITVGCSPVYWGVRRSNHLLDSLRQQEKFFFQSSRELVDQVLLAYQGKIRFDNSPMFLRDESRINYKYTDDRQDNFNYFPPGESDLLDSVLMEVGGQDLLQAAGVFVYKYSLAYVQEGDPCLAVQSHNKAYTRYQPSKYEKNKSIHRLVLLIMKAATVLTEIITASRDIHLLKKKYNKAALNIFFQRVESNQIA